MSAAVEETRSIGSTSPAADPQRSVPAEIPGPIEAFKKTRDE
jgi:hypothetical protein